MGEKCRGNDTFCGEFMIDGRFVCDGLLFGLVPEMSFFFLLGCICMYGVVRNGLREIKVSY